MCILHLLLFFFILQCCLRLDFPCPPHPRRMIWDLKEDDAYRWSSFQGVLEGKIFYVLDLLFVSIPYSVAPNLCHSNLSRIFKNLWNFKIFLCPLKLFCNCPGRKWFSWMEVLFPKFYAKRKMCLLLEMLTKCTLLSLVLLLPPTCQQM